MNPNELLHNKIKKIYDSTITDFKDVVFKYVDIEKIDLFKVVYKATEFDCIQRIMGCDMLMLNSTFEKKPAVLMVFRIPILKETGNKAIADQVMEIVNNIEECFTTVDYLRSIEKKEEKHVYIVAFKVV